MSFRSIDWNMGLLEELIEARGEEVVVETAVACTCRNGDLYGSMIEREGTPASYRRFNCSQCQGDGWIYRNARLVLGLLTGVNPTKDKRLIESGYAMSGDATFSPSLQEGMISDFDKFTFQFPEPLNEGQVILRGAAHMEENAHIDTDLTADQDRLWYIADCNIWCEDENGVVYSQDSDFIFVDRKIQWVGNRPDVGTLYTINYWGFSEWIVVNQPMLRYDRNRDIGPRIILRRKHVAFQTGSKADTPAKRQAEQTAFTTKVKI